MAVSPITLLVLLAVIYAAHGDLEQQESRLYRRLDRFCTELEDFDKVLARKRDSLEKHAVYLRLLANDVHKAHAEATEDKVFWSGVAVGGGIINIAGLVLDYMEKGSPYISAVGLGISTVGGYVQEMVCASEQEQWLTNENNVGRIFKVVEEDLREITDMHSEIQDTLHDLEEEEGLLDTRLHKKLMKIKLRFSRFKPFKIEQNYMDMTSQLFDVVLKLAATTGAIKSVVDTVARNVSPSATKIPTREGVSEKILDGESGISREVLKKNKFPNSKNALRAVTAGASLYQEGKKLYKGIVHLNKGARSELAENICEVAAYLESVIQKLDRFLPKKSS